MGERMPQNCGEAAKHCLFCTFAHLAHLHPQRLALLKPHAGGRWQVTERDAVPIAAINASEFQEQEEQKQRGGASLKWKPSLKQTPNNTYGIQEDEPLLRSPLSLHPSVVHQNIHQNAFCLSNKHHMYDGDETFTYFTLLTLVCAVAMRLREVLTPSVISASTPEHAVGIDPVRTVGILIGSSVEYVVAVLAVLQCGFAFVPLEPSWPARRIARVVTDSEPFVLLTSKQTNKAFRDSIIDSLCSTVLCLDLEHLQPLDPLTGLAHCSCSCHTKSIRSYCYVLYTSGSSGKPMGVYGTETGLMHRLQWMQKEYPFLEDDVAIFKTSVAFVDHLTELFGPLLGGSLVVVPPREELLSSPLGLLHFCQLYNISRLTAVPSLMCALLPTLSTYANSNASLSIKVLVLSGEVLPFNLLKSLQECLPHAIILNLYGCTELSGDCLCFDCSLLEETWDYFSVPIGKPLPGCIVQVISEVSETGDEGELWVGGVLVALGYHNYRSSEGDKFTAVMDPNAAYHNVRFFRTGDYVKRLKDGSLLFLGRKDRIVKLIGNKVSLDEVENSLGRHPLVAQSAVSLQKGVNLDSTIVAYVVLDLNPDCTIHEVPETSRDLSNACGTQTSAIVSSLRSWVIERLPTVMVPGRFVFVRALPFLSSGKIDYLALFDLHMNRLSETSVEVSSSTTRIKRAFELVLKLDNISVDDDFFSLGGTSISAARLAHILAIDMRLLYTHTTVIELESITRALQEETEESLAPNLDDGLPDLRALKRAKKDYTPNAIDSGVSSCCTEQSVSRENSSVRHVVGNDSWPYACMGNAPKALLRCNAGMPKEAFLSVPNLFLGLRAMKGLGTLCVLWKTHLKACVDASPVLMCSQGVCLIFIGSHAHNFLCMDAYNGNVVWEREIGGRVESTAALTSDFKHVIVGSYDGYLYILDTETGTLRWSFQTKAEVKCQPTVDGRGLIWCGSHDRHIYALNVLEQRCVWELDCKASIFAAAAHDSSRFLTYVATTAGTIMAFSTDSPHLQVTWTHGCGAPIFGALAVDAASGYLICTLVNGKVLAFTSSGAISWEYNAGGPVFAGATLTTALPSQVIVCSREGWVYSLHLNSGKCLWKYCLGEPITSAAYVDESLNLVTKESDDDTMYSHHYRLVCACGSSGHVHVLKVYAGSTSLKSNCSFLVQNLNTKNNDGHQRNGLMPESENDNKEGGDSKAEYRDCVAGGGCEFVDVLKLPGDIFSSPVMLGGRIFVGCRDDNLYCLEISGLGLHGKAFTNSCSSNTME